MTRELSIALLAPNPRGLVPVPTVAGPTHPWKARIAIFTVPPRDVVRERRNLIAPQFFRSPPLRSLACCTSFFRVKKTAIPRAITRVSSSEAPTEIFTGDPFLRHKGFRGLTPARLS
jgi:hypothetical protein